MKLKSTKKINDISILVTKEEILKEYVKQYKYNHNIVTKDEYVKTVIEKVLTIIGIIGFVVAFVYILFMSPMNTNTDSVLENAANEIINMMIHIVAFMIPFLLLSIILHIQFEISYYGKNTIWDDFWGDSLGDLKIGLENYESLCNVIQNEFCNKTVEELLMTERIVKDSDQLQLMQYILCNRVEVYKKEDSNKLIAVDVTSGDRFGLGLTLNDDMKGKYNIIVKIDGSYFSKV